MMTNRNYRPAFSYESLTILVFFSLLMAPMIGQLGGLSGAEEIPRIELRQAAKAPSLPRTSEQVRMWPKKAESYLDDHFGFRKWLASMDSQIRVWAGSSGSKKVLVGQDGWLFSRDEKKLSEHRGAIRFTKDEIDHWIKALRRRQRWLKRRSIQHIFVICPTKFEVYTDKLPDWAKPIGPTSFDAIKKRIRSDTDVNLIDLKPLLRNARKKTNSILYSKTDTHWTNAGAIIGYKAIMDALQEYFPKIYVAKKGVDFTFKKGQSPGGLRRMMNIWWGFEEGPVDRISMLPHHGRFSSAEALVDGKWRLCRPGEVGWNLEETSVVNTTLKNAPRVLVFRDSFTIGIHSLLKLSFSSLMFAKHNSNILNTDLIQAFKPDLIIYEMIDDSLLSQPTFYPKRKKRKK